jgi:GT2 family glycosyltransferase
VKIAAVVVAYNRRDLLREALDGIGHQTRKPDTVLVVDNASTDDSAAVAGAHPAVSEVLRLTQNLGGAGGFAAGLARVLASQSVDAVWLMDDDTAPTPTALAELEKAWTGYPGRLAVASSRAVWTDGRIHPMNSQRTRLFASRDERWRARQVGARPIRTGSFVSMLVGADAARAKGLPVADYFIWNDDLEYSARLVRPVRRRRVGQGVDQPGWRGIAVPSSVVVHKTQEFASGLSNPGPRFYFEVRNKLWALVKSGSFGPLDAAAYGAYTLANWLRLVMRSPDSGQRRDLLTAARKGIRDGLLSKPTANAYIFAGQGRIAEQVAAVETGASQR